MLNVSFLILFCNVSAASCSDLPKFEECQSSEESDLVSCESSDSPDLPRPRPNDYDAYVHKIPTALAFAMKQKRGTGKATDIPPELMQGIAEFIPNPLSELQQEIMKNLQFYIETELKTYDSGDLRSAYIAKESRTGIYKSNSRGFCSVGPEKYIYGKISDLERDCMHQVLLKRGANKYLTIQRSDQKPALFAYTLDGYDGRASYLDPAIDYCKLSDPAWNSYNWNPFLDDDDYIPAKSPAWSSYNWNPFLD